MKKILILTVMLFGWVTFSSAQKIAIVDMSYLLKNIPMYESANEQLKQISQKWQKEVDALNEEAELLYKNYQTESVFLSDEMKRKKENEIVAISVMHKGSYENLNKAYAFVLNWVKENGYKIVAPIREVYIDGCWNKDSVNDYLTEIQVPISIK